MDQPRQTSVLTSASEVTAVWLSSVLGQPVARVEYTVKDSSWAQGASIRAVMADGSERALWLKICLGDTFGRSEVDYYLTDYVQLPGAALVNCHDGCFEEGIGYHLLLDDLSQDYSDRKTSPPTLRHGLALAEGLAKLHIHHWESCEPPDSSAWDKYFEQIEPGVRGLELAAGLRLQDRFDSHAEALMARWRDPRGMTLLHGDLNPTNVLTPKGCEEPVFFLDRQPFNWALTYGLAVYDLAYAVVPWWPHDFRKESEEAILRHWFEQVGKADYSWQQARSDWELSVEHCLHIPIEWCREPEQAEQMRWLWQWQLGNILGASS